MQGKIINQNENQNQKENATEITTETFITAEMADKPDVQVRDSRTSRSEMAIILQFFWFWDFIVRGSWVKAMAEQDSAPLVALESAELVAADVEVVLNSALDSIEKEMINMCEVEIQVDVTDFVENDELDGLG